MSEPFRILIIDDSDIVLSRLKQRLTQEGYEVVTTSQTVGAARHLRKCNMVILDYHMPGIDGATVLQSLKAASHDPSTTPLFYLYTSDTSVAVDYKKSGFDGCFANKGNDDSLVQQLAAALRMERLRKLAKK